jgi:HK97 family phage major capsid protein
MSRLHELRETRATKIEEMRAIVAAAEGAGRDLSAEEKAAFDALKGETTALEERIARGETLAEMERRADATPLTGELARETRSYSVAKAVQEFGSSGLTGREAEIQSELARGREARGLMVPAEILLGETRSQTVGNDTAGGYTVARKLAAVVDRFRPALKIESLGATILRNLVGPLDLPNLAASGSTAWIGEDQNATRSTATFEKVAMSPRTVSAEYKISRRLLLQTAQSIEEILRRDLGLILAQALDAAAISGTGVLDPQGVLANPAVELVATAAALGDTASDLIAALELDDVTGSQAFLTNPTAMNVARKIKDGDGLFIPLPETFHGQRVEVSTQVPKTLGVGNDKSALIFGQWSELVIGYWSAIDILPNVYHSDVASAGGMLLHAFLDCDVAVRHPKAFAYSLV